MDKKNDKQKTGAKIRPIIINAATTQHTDILGDKFNFVAKLGEYHLIEVNDKGEEIPGTDFGVIEKTYNLAFKDNLKFKLKKNPIVSR